MKNIKDKYGPYRTVKEMICQEDTTVLNFYVLNKKYNS